MKQLSFSPEEDVAIIPFPIGPPGWVASLGWATSVQHVVSNTTFTVGVQRFALQYFVIWIVHILPPTLHSGCMLLGHISAVHSRSMHCICMFCPSLRNQEATSPE